MPKIKNGITCRDCGLYKKCKSPYMPLGGDINGEILLVGEGPGKEEDERGTQFVGRSGELLRRVLADNHIVSVAFDNAVRCRPPNNRVPSLSEVRACKPFLDKDIMSMPNLKLIVPLGNIAMQALLKKKGISKYNGKLISEKGKLYLPIFHPAYILRNQDELGNFTDAIGRIPNALTGSLVDPTDFGTYTVITTMEQWKSLVVDIRSKREFVYDIETTMLSPFIGGGVIRCIGFSTEPRTASTLPLDTAVWSEEQWKEIYQDLYALFSSQRIGKVGHNIKFDCVTIGHRILTSSLQWVPVESLKIGDVLLGFSENPGNRRPNYRYWKPSIVTACLPDEEDMMEICLSSGKVLTSTSNHPWFIESEPSRRWIKTSDLRPGMKIRQLIPTWDAPRSYEEGWLAAFFDSEGHLQHNPYVPNICASQNEGIVKQQAVEYLHNLGFKVLERQYDKNNPKIKGLWIAGDLGERLRFLGQIRPKRLLSLLDISNLGALKCKKEYQNEYTIVSIRFVGKRPIIRLGTSEKTYLVDGFGAHNSLWMQESLGIEVKGTKWDTKFSQFLLNENASNSLKEMAWRMSRLGGYEQLLGDEPQNVEDKEKLYRYCSTDADITNRIYQTHKDELTKQPNLLFLLSNLLLPVSDVLTHVERHGIRIDPSRVDECEAAVIKVLGGTISKIKREPAVMDFERAVQDEFNPNSHVQLREVLFKYEGLEAVKFTDKTKSPSTARDVLEELSSESNLCRLLIDYSVYTDMKSKMIKGLREHTTTDQRIHTTFSLTRTKTGRSASREPNLQNVTKGDKDVVGIRRCFIADPNCKLLEADYNQHELRCMAEEADDDVLARAILTSDVHRSTAASILGMSEAQVTSEQRRLYGKTFNFGLIYGLTEYGVMERLKCDRLAASMYINKFFNTYQKTKQWMDYITECVKRDGYVTSRTGRVRRFPIFDAMDNTQIREAINAPIQSLASDCLLYGLLGLDVLLRDKKSFVCLEIHDSILFNIHKDEMDLIPEIKRIMEEYHKPYTRMQMPLAVEMKIGDSWGEMEEYVI